MTTHEVMDWVSEKALEVAALRQQIQEYENGYQQLINFVLDGQPESELLKKGAPPNAAIKAYVARLRTEVSRQAITKSDVIEQDA